MICNAHIWAKWFPSYMYPGKEYRACTQCSTGEWRDPPTLAFDDVAVGLTESEDAEEQAEAGSGPAPPMEQWAQEIFKAARDQKEVMDGADKCPTAPPATVSSAPADPRSEALGRAIGGHNQGWQHGWLD